MAPKRGCWLWTCEITIPYGCWALVFLEIPQKHQVLFEDRSSRQASQQETLEASPASSADNKALGSVRSRSSQSKQRLRAPCRQPSVIAIIPGCFWPDDCHECALSAGRIAGASRITVHSLKPPVREVMVLESTVGRSTVQEALVWTAP